MTVGSLFPCLTVKNLGVTLDCHLTMKTRTSILAHSADFELVPSVIFCPQMPQKLLSVSLMVKQTTKKNPNGAAHLVLRIPKTDHSPLASLHWLPIDS